MSATQRWKHPVKCLAQGHNKQTCRLVLHIIPILLSAKQGSVEYHLFKVFWYDSTWEMKPRSIDCEADALTTTPSRRLKLSGKICATLLTLSRCGPMPKMGKIFKYYLSISSLKQTQKTGNAVGTHSIYIFPRWPTRRPWAACGPLKVSVRPS